MSIDTSPEGLAHRRRLSTPSLAVTPAVVAHRGASGYRPEHTLEGYRLAIRMGADDIEIDLVSSRDGVLVARHESDLASTTDIAAHPEFADRQTTRDIGGLEVSGWFVEDFTLAELKRLTARERSAELRPDSAAYDGTCGIPTFNEVLAMVHAESVRAGRTVGVMAALKHATYSESLGLPLDRALLADLRRHGLDHARSRVTVMSFEPTVLRTLAPQTKVSLVQLLGPGSDRPTDLVAAGDPRTYADLCTPAGLAWIDEYADGVGAHSSLVLPGSSPGSPGEPSALVRDAHRRWLTVHVWAGDLATDALAFFEAGVDGLITDHPDVVLAVRGQMG